MILAMTRDIRVVLIKLADRTHNMRTLGSLRSDKRRRIAKETLEIYCPLAHRLGIEHIKNELEDLSFEAMHPRRYEVLKKLVEQARGSRQELIQRISNDISQRLDNVGDVYKRQPKSHKALNTFSPSWHLNCCLSDAFNVSRFHNVVCFTDRVCVFNH